MSVHKKARISSLKAIFSSRRRIRMRAKHKLICSSSFVFSFGNYSSNLPTFPFLLTYSAGCNIRNVFKQFIFGISGHTPYHRKRIKVRSLLRVYFSMHAHTSICRRFLICIFLSFFSPEYVFLSSLVEFFLSLFVYFGFVVENARLFIEILLPYERFGATLSSPINL